MSVQPHEEQHPLLTASARGPELNEDDLDSSSETRACVHVCVLIPPLLVSIPGNRQSHAVPRGSGAVLCTVSAPAQHPSWGG